MADSSGPSVVLPASERQCGVSVIWAIFVARPQVPLTQTVVGEPAAAISVPRVVAGGVAFVVAAFAEGSSVREAVPQLGGVQPETRHVRLAGYRRLGRGGTS
jgi:hypothetical protein